MRVYVGDETEDFVKRFVGKKDSFDSFRILKAPVGPLYGDCDDFAVSMLWRVEGRSMTKFWLSLLTGRSAIWRTYSDNGVPHAALWHRDYGWIDSTKMYWRDEPELRLRYKRWPSTVALKMIVGKFTK